MFVNLEKKLLLFVFCLIFFGSCEDLGIVLPIEGTYQIKTLVNNISLEDCSIVQTGDIIRPQCDDSITKDPDVRGLLVIIQNSKKEITGGKIRYILGDSADITSILEIDNSSSDSPPDEKKSDKSAGPDAETEDPEKTANEETVIIVNRLDMNLPSFIFPEGMEIGAYTLVFKILGEREILGEIEENFYYLDDVVFTLNDIQISLPGVFTASQLIPLGTTVMLEANVEADANLNPYIIWYEGKKIISEGLLSEGAGVILWEASGHSGFQTLRAEVFPVTNHEGINGISREIILPVSSKAPDAGFFSAANPEDIEWLTEDQSAATELKQKPELLRWYQFAGNFSDSSDSPAAANSLIYSPERPPRWKRTGYSYGLSVGQYDEYFLTPLSFINDDQDKGGGAFLVRAKPVSDGILINANFASTTSKESLKINFLLKSDVLVLESIPADLPVEEAAVPLEAFESDSGLSIFVVFYLYSDQFEIELFSEKNPLKQIYSGIIPISEPLNGECRICLGSQDYNLLEVFLNAPGERPSSERTASQISNRYNLPLTAIMDQFAVMHITPPQEHKVIVEPAVITETEEPVQTEAVIISDAEEAIIDNQNTEIAYKAESDAETDTIEKQETEAPYNTGFFAEAKSSEQITNSENTEKSEPSERDAENN